MLLKEHAIRVEVNSRSETARDDEEGTTGDALVWVGEGKEAGEGSRALT